MDQNELKKKLYGSMGGSDEDFAKFLADRQANAQSPEEVKLQAEDKPLETPLIAPDEIILGGLPSAIRGLGKAASSELGERLLMNEIGGIGKGVDAATRGGGMVARASNIPTSEFGNIARGIGQRAGSLPSDVAAKRAAIYEQIAKGATTEADTFLPKIAERLAATKDPVEKAKLLDMQKRLISSQGK